MTLVDARDVLEDVRDTGDDTVVVDTHVIVDVVAVIVLVGGRAHKGLKSPKRFTNLPLDSSRCPGEKGRACIKRKKILGILL